MPPQTQDGLPPQANAMLAKLAAATSKYAAKLKPGLQGAPPAGAGVTAIQSPAEARKPRLPSIGLKPQLPQVSWPAIWTPPGADTEVPIFQALAGKRKAEVMAPIFQQVQPTSKKQKTAKKATAGALAVPDGLCYDFMSKNGCAKGDACPLNHAATQEFLSVKANVGSRVSGRSDEERAAAKADYQSWAEERLDKGSDPSGSNAQSCDWWYCQTCLVCLKECDWNVYMGTHKNGAAHKKQYMADGGYSLKEGVLRPNPQLTKPLANGTIPRFISCTGFARSKVLALGEQDYSFSLSIAKLQAQTGGTQLVATSYLAAHDPDEPEIHVRDDGMRAWYSRRSLPSMEGALQKNIDDCRNLGGVVLHSVDATDLPGTLLTQTGDTYNVIVFPFPRASLQRGCQPKNPRLIRNFFRSVNEAEILEPGGKIGIVLLRTQFAEWDIACLGLEAGFHLVDQATLPDGWYQGREMSGKIFDSWKGIGAEIYMFQHEDGMLVSRRY